MRKLITTLGLILAGLFLFVDQVQAQDPATLRVTVTQLRNNYDCGNDAWGICCGCWISICNDPDPRWRARGGAGGNFGLGYGWQFFNGGEQTCAIWDITDRDLMYANVGTATTFNVDAETWEEDGFFGWCGSTDYTFEDDNWCGFGFDGDDVHWGPGRLADINFRGTPPCAPYDWGWYYTRNGYAFRLQSFYTWTTQPSFTTQPSSPYTVCPGVPLSFTAATNTSNGVPVANFYQWQTSTGASWTNIPGATSTTYSLTATNSGATTLTTYYRLLATSNCTADFSTRTVISSTVTVNVLAPGDPLCNLPSCNAIYVDPVNGNDGITASNNRPSSAYKTLSRALQDVAAGNTTLKHIKLASGTINEAAGTLVTLKPYVIVEGGYVAGTGGADWKKSTSATTTITGSYASASAPTGIIGIYANGISNWKLQDLTITTPNTGTSGYSNHGVYAQGCSNYEIIRCNITAGQAGPSGAGSYGVYLNTPGAGGLILDSRISGTAGGGGVTYAIGQAGGTAPTITLTNSGGTCGGACINSAATTGGAVNVPTATEALSGSVRVNMPGKYCVNSEIDLTKAAGNWTFPQTTSGAGTLSIVEDLKVGSSSYTNASSPIKVYTTTGGDYDLTVNSGTLSRYISVAPTTEFNRTLPVIAASPSTICVGGTGVGLSISSGSYDATNILQREWLIYTDAQGPNSPEFSVSSPTATSINVGPFNSVGVYNVRYRERHNCCGWSKPVFTTITVVADPTAPVMTRQPLDTVICAGTQVRSAITIPTDGVGCSTTLEYSVDNQVWLPYTSNTYIGSAASSSIRIRATRDCSSGNGCTPVVFSEELWVVTPQPTIFTQPQPLSVCNGSAATLSTLVVDGVDMSYQWQQGAGACSGYTDISGATSQTYSPSTATNGVTYYRVIASSASATSGCSSLTSNCATLTVSAHPTSGPVTPNPNIDTICSGTSITASFGGGSNGVGCSDIQEYRFDGSGSWLPYSGSISSTGHTTIEVRNYRGMCDSIAVCTDATPNVATWVIIPPPTSGTLTKNPNVADVCTGATVSATLSTPGTGGKGCSDIIEYRTYSTGGVWSSWTAGSSVTTNAFMTQVEMRTYRGNCNALSGCPDAAPNVISWNVIPQPTLSDPSVSNGGLLCSSAGSVSISSTVSGGSTNNTPRWEYYNGSTWVKVSNGTPTGAVYTDTTGTISVSGIANQGTYIYRYYLSANSLNCGPVTSDTLKLVVPAPFTTGTISTVAQTKCSGTAMSSITLTSNPAPWPASYNYQWYQNTGVSPACPTAGSDVATITAAGWTSVTGGSGGSTSVFTPPATTGTITYLLMVDPLDYPDCSSFKSSGNCNTVTVYPPVNKGAISGIDSVCGSAGDAAAFGFTITPGATPPSGGAGTFTYQWYSIANDVTPPAGSSTVGSWSIISGATSDSYDPPAGSITATRSFACMINATGTPDCDAPTNATWATGRFLVKISNIFSVGVISPTPSYVCNDNPAQINGTSTTGPAGTQYFQKWYKRTTDTAWCPTSRSGRFFAHFQELTPTWSSTANSYDPPSATMGSDSVVYIRIDSLRTQCNSSQIRVTNCVTVKLNSDLAPINTLSSINASQTKTLNVNKWYHFWNANCELIASVNPNGQNLGNVTMQVNVDSTKYTFPNGGYGREQTCLNKNELAMGRYYKMTTQNTPGSGTTLVRLYYNTTDYNSYMSAIAALPYVSMYQICYGYSTAPGDLSVSRNALTDMTISPTTILPTTPNIVINEFALPPSLLRVGGPEETNAGPTSYYFHTNGGIGEPLPIELLSFVGWNDNEFNQLRWVTASEENSARFIIEKSANATTNWMSIGEVNAAGNSNTERTYNFTDVNPVIGNNYYRLRIVDIDGDFEYSNVINIPLSKATRNALLGVYPNPTDGLLNVELQSTENFTTQLKVFDVLGQEVTSQTISIAKGLNKFQMNYKDLAKANYILSYRDNHGVQYQIKFVKD